MTPTESKTIIAVLSAAFPHSKGDANTVEVYCKALADLDYAAVDVAAQACIMTMRFMPTVAELRAMVIDSNNGPRRTGLEAWGDVVKLISSKGARRTPGVDFEIADPVARHVVDAMSWSELCAGENRAADRARFIDAYEQITIDEVRARQSGGILPQRHLPPPMRQLAAGGAQAIGKLLHLPPPSQPLQLMPWESEDDQ